MKEGSNEDRDDQFADGVDVDAAAAGLRSDDELVEVIAPQLRDVQLDALDLWVRGERIRERNHVKGLHGNFVEGERFVGGHYQNGTVHLLLFHLPSSVDPHGAVWNDRFLGFGADLDTIMSTACEIQLFLLRIDEVVDLNQSGTANNRNKTTVIGKTDGENRSLRNKGNRGRQLHRKQGQVAKRLKEHSTAISPISSK